ncbi:hypothetical protein PI126_g20440 [Phytophthora idaei]|nr:hypothetical protein PI126_g20440 [Phytophthora idaei]
MLTLRTELDAFLNLPFAALLHDLWTNAANVNIIGATVVFIYIQNGD